MIFYRVAHNETGQGLWYDNAGNYTGLIRDVYSFCKNTRLPMPFDPEVRGWLSATRSMDELFEWFPQCDIIQLERYGYYATEYKAAFARKYENHWLIHAQTSQREHIHIISEAQND